MDTQEPTTLPKSYHFLESETKWYRFWEENRFFEADPSSEKPPFCIVIPPPNVTGVLHMGHALVQTLQDILIRWKRMSGFETLWVPGTDHAGIATQTVVERNLIKQTGKKRRDFPREEFLEKVWEWKERNESRIIEQLKGLGCSCDWSRQRFTMDEGNNRAVRSFFKKLYDDDLIYRGDYLVNWDPVTQTALADDEVEYEEQESFLWHFQYPLVDGEGAIPIATTRPETMLGDTAVAVSPKDPRFQSFIGKKVLQPLTGRELSVIADPFVDPEFGTGAVKITPSHDPNDYQMGMRHDLPFINMMTPDGRITKEFSDFAGMTMEEGRVAVTEAMRSMGYFLKKEPHTLRIGISYRSKAIIEPYMSKQWFVKMTPFKQILTDVVEQGRLQLIPENWINTYRHWIDNLRDWCISRQLWWGHRIPIWYHIADHERQICYDGEGVPPEVAASPDEWVQDEDVLDTWFSSALWPFATLGWPEKTPELKRFYPNSVLVTGHDILFFWVARMVAMGEYALKELPFPKVFLHGLIYGKSYWRTEEGTIHYVSEEERVAFDLGAPVPPDVKSHWEKMSKSKGNVIDPLEIGQQYGTDAMRMALCSSPTQSRQIDLDRRKFEDFKNFANKLWNGTRFVLMNLEDVDSTLLTKKMDPSSLALEDRWLLSALTRVVREVNDHLEQYQFDHAAMKAYDFFWNQFCAYYVEITKPVLFGKVGTPEERTTKQQLLLIALCSALRLIHPMAPFVTEELFQKVKQVVGPLPENTEENSDPFSKEALEALKTPSCAIAPYPQIVDTAAEDTEVNDLFELMSRLVYAIRNIRGEMGLSPGTATDIYLIGGKSDTIAAHTRIISSLVRTKDLIIKKEEPKATFTSSSLVDGIKIVIPLPEELIAKERLRLEKELEKSTTTIAKLEKQLSNEQFVARAPAELVAKQKEQLLYSRQQLEEITKKLGVQ